MPIKKTTPDVLDFFVGNITIFKTYCIRHIMIFSMNASASVEFSAPHGRFVRGRIAWRGGIDDCSARHLRWMQNLFNPQGWAAGYLTKLVLGY